MNYLRSRKPLSPLRFRSRGVQVKYNFCGKTHRSFKQEDLKIINDRCEIKVNNKRRGFSRVKNALGNEVVS